MSPKPGLSNRLRKERERQEREMRYLDVARKLLLERGYLGLTMDAVAEATEFSKGTLYQHFGSKEELLLALVAGLTERKLELFERAALWPGPSRERMLAIGRAYRAFAGRYPEDLRVTQIALSEPLRAKAGPASVERLAGVETRCQGVLLGVIRDGIARGELPWDNSRHPGELAFTLWATSFGHYTLAALDLDFGALGVSDPLATLDHTCQALLDGWGWRPLSHELDWNALGERIDRELFSPAAEQRKGAARHP
jgi:AcrR family transcriptional regulator